MDLISWIIKWFVVLQCKAIFITLFNVIPWNPRTLNSHEQWWFHSRCGEFYSCTSILLIRWQFSFQCLFQRKFSIRERYAVGFRIFLINIFILLWQIKKGEKNWFSTDQISGISPKKPNFYQCSYLNKNPIWCYFTNHYWFISQTLTCICFCRH